MTPFQAFAELQSSVGPDAVQTAIDDIEARMARWPLAFMHEEGDLAREHLWHLRELKARMTERAHRLAVPMAARVSADEAEGVTLEEAA